MTTSTTTSLPASVCSTCSRFTFWCRTRQRLDCLRFNVQLLLLSNKATGWASQDPEMQLKAHRKPSKWIFEQFCRVWLSGLTWWRQRGCWGNSWSVAHPGCPTCCLVALQVELCVRLNPNVPPPDSTQTQTWPNCFKLLGMNVHSQRKLCVHPNLNKDQTSWLAETNSSQEVGTEGKTPGRNPPQSFTIDFIKIVSTILKDSLNYPVFLNRLLC